MKFWSKWYWSREAATITTCLIILLALAPQVTHASISSCSANVTPHLITRGSATGYDFDLTAGGSTAVRWIKVTRPFDDMTIYDSSTDWNVDLTDDTAVLTGSSLAPDSTMYFRLIAQAGDSGGGNWRVEVSDSPSGTSPISCSGDLSGNIPGDITLSNIGLASVSSTSVTIIWDTDVPATSQVNYGEDTSYSSSSSLNGSLVTHHNVQLSGLQPNTLYHYQVSSTTPANGGSTVSDDNTFLTAVKPTANEQIVTIVAGNNSGGVPIKSTPTETVPPTISLTSKIPSIVKSIPMISGVADDNEALARVEYSTDGGKNWLPTETATGLGGKHAAFSFTPVIQDDGNYSIMARAIDTSGNMTATSAVPIVLDRLPPVFGNLVTSFGSQALLVNSQGVMLLAKGSNYRVSGQAVGGPLRVDLVAKSTAGKTQTFSLVQDSESGLWSGAVSFLKSGTYQLTVKAVDGANNLTERSLGKVMVSSPGQVTDSQNKAIKDAKITLYYMEPSMRRWVVWDGKPYGQVNPQHVKDSAYSLMAPSGEYYLQASAPGYGTVVSRRFKLDTPQSLTLHFTLPGHTLVKLGSQHVAVPTWATVTNDSPVQTVIASEAKKQSSQSLPSFNLPKLSGGNAQTVDLFGKPTVITILNTWSPSGNDQLDALAKVQKNTDVGVVPLFEGERPDAVKAYLQLAGIKLDGLADPDNTVAESLGAGFGPKHIFIDRSGHIKKVMFGVLSEDKILETLGGQ